MRMNDREVRLAALSPEIGAPALGRLPKVDFQTAMRAAAPSVVSLVRLMSVATRLNRGPGGLSPAEFFSHRLWDPLFGRGDLQRFVGLSGQGRFHAACCDIAWKAIADDKILSTALLVGPGATALRWAKRPGLALALAALVGLGATFLGILLAYDSYYWSSAQRGWPVSFFVVCVLFVAYVLPGSARSGRRRAREERSRSAATFPAKV